MKKMADGNASSTCTIPPTVNSTEPMCTHIKMIMIEMALTASAKSLNSCSSTYASFTSELAVS